MLMNFPSWGNSTEDFLKACIGGKKYYRRVNQTPMCNLLYKPILGPNFCTRTVNKFCQISVHATLIMTSAVPRQQLSGPSEQNFKFRQSAS